MMNNMITDIKIQKELNLDSTKNLKDENKKPRKFECVQKIGLSRFETVYSLQNYEMKKKIFI